MQRYCLHKYGGIFLATIALLFCVYSASATDRYVSTNSTPSSPYTSWATAASSIQDAVNVSVDHDVVLVSNGVYNTGETVDSDGHKNRIYVSKKNVSIRSVNGPKHTVIAGSGPAGPNGVRCAYIRGWPPYGGRAQLIGFTLMDGHSDTNTSYDRAASGGAFFGEDADISDCILLNNQSSFGGGAFVRGWANVTRCTFTNNEAYESGGGLYIDGNDAQVYDCIVRGNVAQYGGGIDVDAGADAAMIKNCLVQGNQATNGYGGGIQVNNGGQIRSCTITGNSAPVAGGGGVKFYGRGVLENSIVFGNTGYSSTDHDLALVSFTNGSIEFTCAQYLPDNSLIASNTMVLSSPIFIGAGDYHLSSNSPCIDAGTNLVNTSDLDGVDRPLDGNNDGTNTQDMGCFEFAGVALDTDGDGLADSDEIHVYGTNPSVADSDGDGLDDYCEAGTNGYYPSHHIYIIARPSSGSANWVTCKTEAEGLGGHLATITSSYEWNNVCYQLGTNMDNKAIWIGAYYTNASWAWVSGEPFSYERWAPSEPQGGNDSVALRNGTAPDIAWDGFQNSSTWLDYFLVEFTNNAAITDPWNPDCDDDGLLDGEEVNVSTYQMISNTVNLNWVQSEADAESRGGHLATITSYKEWQQIDSLLHNQMTNKYFWIGGRLVAGAWTWVTGETWAYTRWDTKGHFPIPQSDCDSLSIWENEFISNPTLLWANMQNSSSSLDWYLLEKPANAYVTDPHNPDSDGDTMSDGDEVISGTSPTNATELFKVDTIIPGSGPDMVISWNSLATRQYTAFLSTNLLSSWTNDMSFTDVRGNDGLMSYTNSSGLNASYYKIGVEIAP